MHGREREDLAVRRLKQPSLSHDPLSFNHLAAKTLYTHETVLILGDQPLRTNSGSGDGIHDPLRFAEITPFNAFDKATNRRVFASIRRFPE